MRTLLLLVSSMIAMACTACATAPSEPIIETHEVAYPVEVKCHAELPIKPEALLTKDDLGTGLYDRGSALLEEAEALREYVKQLEPAIAKCIEPPGPPPPKSP